LKKWKTLVSPRIFHAIAFSVQTETSEHLKRLRARFRLSRASSLSLPEISTPITFLNGIAAAHATILPNPDP
jgi:hypothetical protein